VIRTQDGFKAGLAGPVKYGPIGRAGKAMVVDALESRQRVVQCSNQLGREILVEKNTHWLAATKGPISHVGSESIHGCEVLFLKTGVLIENLFLGHAVRQPAENIIYRDSHPANAGLSVALIRFDGNSRV